MVLNSYAAFYLQISKCCDAEHHYLCFTDVEMGAQKVIYQGHVEDYEVRSRTD